MTPGEISLREYVDSRFDAHHREHILIENSLEKAEAAMNRRLETMNEFRAQLNEQKADFATKEMIVPITRFHDKFWGVLAGMTVLNVLLTTLIVLLFRAWAGMR